MIIVEGYMTVEDYAKASGISTRAIRTRYKNCKIYYFKINQHILLSTQYSPPSYFLNPHEKKIVEAVICPPNIDDIKSLIAIKDYVKKKKLRGYNIFELAMMNKIQCFMIAGIAFAYKSELDAIPKTKKKSKK